MSTEKSEMFSSEWYDEYFRRAESSPAHAEFCRSVYGKNLCQHGLMDMEELDFLISLIAPKTNILEIGCANGYITEYIQEKTNCKILGLDYSKTAIEQAKERTKGKRAKIQFQRVDLTQEELPEAQYDYIILIDSIYFLGDFEATLKRINAKLAPAGKMLISFFDTSDEETGRQLPAPKETWLAEALEQFGAAYQWHDFTANIRAHGIKNYQAGEALKEIFAQEGNQFLYEARAAENRFFKESAEEESIVRYLYVVNRRIDAT